jgi:hypothetical protein
MGIVVEAYTELLIRTPLEMPFLYRGFLCMKNFQPLPRLLRFHNSILINSHKVCLATSLKGQ